MTERRNRFKIEFSPLPIPTESPDAPGGSYFYLSRQWKAYVRGMVSYLGMRRFWQDAPEQYDEILQWVYQLLDEIDLPTDIIEVPIYIPSEDLNDTDECECEENFMACNCGNNANVRYCEDTGWEYRGSDGLWKPVPGSAGVPSVDEQEELEGEETPYPTVNQNACEKAHAVWDVLVRYMEAIEETTPEFDFAPIPVVIEQRQFSAWWVANMKLHKPFLPVQTFNALYGLVYWFAPPNHHAVMDAFRAQQDFIRDEVICAWQDFVTKENRLGDEELEAMREYKPDTGILHLDDMLQQTLKRVISTDFLKQEAVNYIRSASHTCECIGASPVPPPPDIPEGYGRIEWYATRALDYTATDPNPDGGSGFNPEEIIAFEASEGGDAENIDNDSWRSVLSYNDVNRGLGIIFKTPDDVRITKVSFAAALEGATPPGTILHAGYFSATEAGTWTTELKRDNLVPGEFPFPLVEFPGLAGCHYFYFSIVILGGDETTNIRLDNIKFDIAADDGTWTRTGVKAEQLFPL